MVAFRELRQKKLMSIRDLAKRADVTAQTIVNIEQGKRIPRPNTMAKLAEALSVEPGEIDEFAEPIRIWLSGERLPSSDL